MRTVIGALIGFSAGCASAEVAAPLLWPFGTVALFLAVTIILRDVS